MAKPRSAFDPGDATRRRLLVFGLSSPQPRPCGRRIDQAARPTLALLLTPALLLTATSLLLTAGCTEPSSGGDASSATAHQKASATAATRQQAAARHDEAAPAVPLPPKVTPGDVLPPVPPLPRRLAGPGAAVGAGPQLPAISCARMAPDGTFKVSRHIEVARLGRDVATTLNTPTPRPPDTQGKGAGKPAASKSSTSTGVLELCLFHKWRNREAGENRTHTGRVHHFVAAFPGSDVTSWTADELHRTPETLPADAAWLSAGWASLLPTGLPDRPALAIISARFYDGKLGEEVHYVRKARVLQMHNGRWAWVPWMNRTYKTLDVAHLRTACERGNTPGCRRAAARIAAAESSARKRLKRREARLAGRGHNKVGKDTPDPQSAWIAQGRKMLREGRWKEAIDVALRTEVVCGEAVRDARRIMGRALQIGKVKAELSEPPVNRRPLCEPLVDKAPPRTRKVGQKD